MTYSLSTSWTIILIIGIAWELIWKGWALWRAARSDQLVWFALLLIINSVGVLPIIYLLSHHEYSQSSLAHKGAAL